MYRGITGAWSLRVRQAAPADLDDHQTLLETVLFLEIPDSDRVNPDACFNE